MRKAVVSPGAVVKANNDLLTLANSIGRTVNGNKCSTGASAGQFVVLLNSTISGRSDGLYTASKAIPANTAIDSSYLTVADEGGLNLLNSKFTPQYGNITTKTGVTIYNGVLIKISGIIILSGTIQITSQKEQGDALLELDIKPSNRTDFGLGGYNCYLNSSGNKGNVMADAAIPTGFYAFNVVALAS